MTKHCLTKGCISGTILLWAAGLLLLPRPAAAQVTVTGPASSTAHALFTWFQQHVPAKFQARDKVEVQALSDAAMDDYLHTDSEDAQSDASSDDEIDGVFTNNPPQIFLRVPSTGPLDYATFAHEYGHYVWFDLLTKDDRKRYKAIYDRQKSTHRLISDYAGESLEEGFAEAFSTDMADPAALQRQDPLSCQFLSRWPKAQ